MKPVPAPRAQLSDLASLAQQGDEAALSRLLRALSARLPGLVFGELATRGYHLSEADVQDLAQEVLISVWQKDLGRYCPERGAFVAFVRGRVRWAVADAVRKRSRRAQVPLEREGGQELEAVGARPDEVCAQTDRELKLLVLPRLVLHALAADDAACAAVVGNDLERRTLAEVAEGLGVHTSNACRARKRGLSLLQQRLPAELRAAA
jgi:RNA polymerase sigma factor (sigma-70 family)